MKEKLNINIEQVEDNDMCFICQDEINTKISCNHYFHEECTNRWIEESNNNTCPYCRKHLNLKKRK